MESLGIYISVPFCRAKCTYCNFASAVFPESYHELYVDRLIADMSSLRSQVSPLGAKVPDLVDSIYLGGGTPSLLAPGLLVRLFAALRYEFNVDSQAEITLECAPGQVEDAFLAAMAECGVNRVSFGVQSFIDTEAAVTGRSHSRAIALDDIARVRRAGIPSVNVDLIAGLPHQTAESWRESLGVLLSAETDHASVYMLEVDQDSRLGRELIDRGERFHAAAVPSDDLTPDFYLEAIETLNGNGLPQYEISNFARAGAESIHNKRYWQRRPYVGFGLDAHSMLKMQEGQSLRWQTGDQLQSFLDAPEWSNVDPISQRRSLEEAFFLGLRMNEGVCLAALEAEFGKDLACRYGDTLDELGQWGLIELQASRACLTPRGRLLSNEVFERFLNTEPLSEPELVTVD